MRKICSFITVGVLLLGGCSEKKQETSSVKEWVPLVKYTKPENSQYAPILNSQGSPAAIIEPVQDSKVRTPEYLVTVTRDWNGVDLDVEGIVTPTRIKKFSRLGGYSEITESDGALLTFSIDQIGDLVTGELAGIKFELPKTNNKKGLFFHNLVGQTETRSVMVFGSKVGVVTVENLEMTQYKNAYSVQLNLDSPYNVHNTVTIYQFDGDGMGTVMVSVGKHEGVTILVKAKRK